MVGQVFQLVIQEHFCKCLSIKTRLLHVEIKTGSET